MVVRDVRQIIDENFVPETREIQGVELGDLRPPTIQDVAKPVDRSQITATNPVKEEI